MPARIRPIDAIKADTSGQYVLMLFRRTYRLRFHLSRCSGIAADGRRI